MDRPSDMQPARAEPIRLTYDDYLGFPDDGRRHELIDGEHFVSPSPTTTHQEISKRLFRKLDAFVERHHLGEVLYAPFDIKLSAWTVLVPDLVYFTAARFEEVVNEKHATAAPDLVVEILSPGTRRRDLGRKRAVYDRDGVREYWIVDPEAQTITALRRARQGEGLSDVAVHAPAARDILESPLFPGLKLRLRDVFRSALGRAAARL
jgi:Uma2 family endonuclease